MHVSLSLLPAYLATSRTHALPTHAIKRILAIHPGVRRPGGVRLHPGIYGTRMYGAPLRPDLRARGSLQRSRLLRVHGWLVRPQLHRPRVLANLRQRRELHGAGDLHVPVRVVGRGRSRGGGCGCGWGRGGGRLPRSRVRSGVHERRVVRRPGHVRLSAPVDRARLCNACLHPGERGEALNRWMGHRAFY